MKQSGEKVILEVKNLKKFYPLKRGLFYRIVGWVKAVDGVSFSIKEGKTLGLVGESGCGKSTLAKCILRLIEPDEGSIYFDDHDLTHLPLRKIARLRKNFQIIFQDPFNSLDPRFTVGEIIQEGLLQFLPKKNKKEIIELLKRILKEVGLPQDSLNRYPHQFSGGQRQRISLARALILKPKLLILDEPLSSLDVSIQAQIINLLLKLQEKLGLTYLFITHDLNVIRYISDQVCVMYLGKIVERGEVKDIYVHPLHPYTEALFSAIPTLGRRGEEKRIILKGDLPGAVNLPSGCRFHPRCIYARKKCKEDEPELILKNGRYIACHYPL